MGDTVVSRTVRITCADCGLKRVRLGTVRMTTHIDARAKTVSVRMNDADVELATWGAAIHRRMHERE